MTLTVPGRPVLRYHGGKWLLARWLIANFPPHHIYTEAFGGAASVLMQKPAVHGEVYNDLDGDVVNVFRVLRDEVLAARLHALLTLTPFARDEFALAYEHAADPVETARRTIVRSFMGFGSASTNREHTTGFRANSNRSGTVPARDWATYADALPGFTSRLRMVTIENRDAAEVIAAHDRADCLHYVDPPYPLGTRYEGATREGCYSFEMTDDQHRDLAKTLRGVSGMVVLSGYPCDLYDQDLYPDWRRVARAALADGAKARTEVLWLNPAAAARTVAQMQWDNVAQPTQGGDGVGGV